MGTLDYEAKVETIMSRIDGSDEIHPANKELLKEFKRDLKLDGLSDAWLSKVLGHLAIIAEEVGPETRFEDQEKGDIKDLVEWAQTKKKDNGETVSAATASAYKQAIKRFWKWKADLPGDEHPEETDWINTKGGVSNDNGKLPKDLLTREDIGDLKDACRNDRDRAFIAMLYETGARIGELIDLTIGDIEDHKHGRKVVINGKTGPRRLPLLEATPALNDWMNKHPTGDKSDPLWSKLRSPEKLSYHYIRQKLLVRAKERAGIEKPVNPHHFRHSRATHMANDFKEAQLCEWFGWVQGSDVPAKYVHLSGRDIDRAYGALHGIETEEDEDNGPTIKECWRCEEINEIDDHFCSRCGATLDEVADSIAEQVESDVKADYRDVDPDDKEGQEAIEAVDKATEDPEALEVLAQRIEELESRLADVDG